MTEKEKAETADGDGTDSIADGSDSRVPQSSDAFDFDDPVDLTPEKTGLLEQLRADLDVPGSFDEIVDNSLDAFERILDSEGELNIKINYHETEDGGEELVIRDNAGGVPPKDLKAFFSLGSSAGNGAGQGVQRGAYGVGLKKATLRLAKEVTFATRHIDQTGEDKPGYGFSISEQWLKEEKNWQVDPEPFDIKPGTTEIRLRDLRFDWEEKEEEIQTSVASTYRRQIGGSPFSEDFDVGIAVQDTDLQPPELINWGYPAFDKLWPREFITEISPDDEDVNIDLEEPIQIRLVVGLLAEKDSEATGTDLYVQNRLIHEARTDEQGGYGVPEGLPGFNNAQHGRFKMCLSIESEADAAKLPWNTTKDRIFPEDDKMVAVWDKIYNFVDRHFKAKFSEVPAAYLSFPADHGHAANGGQVEGPLDYKGRDRVTDKPTKGYPDVQEVEAIAEAHAKLGIQRQEYFDDSDTTLREQKREVYLARTKTFFKQEFKPGTEYLSAPKSVMAVLPDFQDIDVNLTVEEVRSDAHQHALKGVRYTGLDPWKQPLYEAYLRSFTEDEEQFDALDPVDERPDTPDDPDGGDDTSDDEVDSEPEEWRFEFTHEGSETVAEVFGLNEDMTAEERGGRVEKAAQRLQELGVTLSLE